MHQSRREFLASTANSLAVLSLCQLGLSTRAIARSISPVIERWLREVEDLAATVKTEAIPQSQWQSQMAELYRRLDLSEFLRLIDFERLAARRTLPDVGEAFDDYSFPAIDGLPAEPTFYCDVAGFHRGRSIPPHGHNHLVSSFLVLRGELRGRHFDRLQDEGDHLYLQPSIDQVFKAGDFSTVSQEKDNVHWFTALTEGAFIFDIGVGGLRPTGTTRPLPGNGPFKSGRIYLDVDNAARNEDGLLEALRISELDAYSRYGA